MIGKQTLKPKKKPLTTSIKPTAKTHTLDIVGHQDFVDVCEYFDLLAIVSNAVICNLKCTISNDIAIYHARFE